MMIKGCHLNFPDETSILHICVIFEVKNKILMLNKRLGIGIDIAGLLAIVSNVLNA